MLLKISQCTGNPSPNKASLAPNIDSTALEKPCTNSVVSLPKSNSPQFHLSLISINTQINNQKSGVSLSKEEKKNKQITSKNPFIHSTKMFSTVLCTEDAVVLKTDSISAFV